MIDNAAIDIYALLFAIGCASIATLIALFLLFLLTVLGEYFDDSEDDSDF